MGFTFTGHIWKRIWESQDFTHVVGFLFLHLSTLTKDKTMNEIIYVLINEAMPGYVKIGLTTTSLEQRMRELSNSTSIPVPFSCFYACTVKDSKFVEKQLHDAFSDHRANPKREFFIISPERVVAALKLAKIEEVTPRGDIVENQDDQKALDNVRERRPIFNFEMVKIPVGSELSFVNDENIKVSVVDNKFISFNGEVTSLSKAAQKLLDYKYAPQGPLYWIYDGETLDQRKLRMENQE